MSASLLAARALKSGASNVAGAAQDLASKASAPAGGITARGVGSEMSLPGTPASGGAHPGPIPSTSRPSQTDASSRSLLSRATTGPAFAPASAAGQSLARTTSRSASRRRSSSAHSFHHPQNHALQVVRNPQGNIGLQNALHAIEGETKGMVWVGALGDKTDNLSDHVRVDIESALWEGEDGGMNRARPVWIKDQVFEGFCESCFQSLVLIVLRCISDKKG